MKGVLFRSRSSKGDDGGRGGNPCGSGLDVAVETSFCSKLSFDVEVLNAFGTAGAAARSGPGWIAETDCVWLDPMLEAFCASISFIKVKVGDLAPS